jgi:hypothetical protein
LSAFGFFTSRVLFFCPLAIMVSCAADRSIRSLVPTLPDLHANHESGHEPPDIDRGGSERPRYLDQMRGPQGAKKRPVARRQDIGSSFGKSCRDFA